MFEPANRVLVAIAAAEKIIQDRGLSPARAKAASRALDISLEELQLFQEKKQWAKDRGLITLEEAQTIFALLGYSPETFNAQSIGAKLTITKLMTDWTSPAARKAG